MNTRLHLAISGRVQGVGFRWVTQRKAVSLGLSGWVKNLSDGRVEAEFEGGAESLSQMLAWCRRGPSGAEVTDVERLADTEEAPYASFDIRY